MADVGSSTAHGLNTLAAYGNPNNEIERSKTELEHLRAELLKAGIDLHYTITSRADRIAGTTHAEDSNRNRHVSDALTKRETEVLKCIAEGHNTKQVAEILGITHNTVVCHRCRLMEKLGIHSVAGLVRYAIRNGLVQA
jgi:DNA-binding NarL/FixJ family response regulator